MLKPVQPIACHTHRLPHEPPHAFVIAFKRGAGGRIFRLAMDLPDSSHYFRMSRQFAARLAGAITDCLKQTEGRRSTTYPKTYTPPIICPTRKTHIKNPYACAAAYKPDWPDEMLRLTIYMTGFGGDFMMTRDFARRIAATITECLERTK